MLLIILAHSNAFCLSCSVFSIPSPSYYISVSLDLFSCPSLFFIYFYTSYSPTLPLCPLTHILTLCLSLYLPVLLTPSLSFYPGVSLPIPSCPSLIRCGANGDLWGAQEGASRAGGECTYFVSAHLSLLCQSNFALPHPNQPFLLFISCVGHSCVADLRVLARYQARYNM